MGNRSSSHQQHGLACPSETDLSDFRLVRFLGAGTFGKVFVFLHEGLKKEYALKVMQKQRICKKKFADNVLSELELLQRLSHPFILCLWYAFQDNDHIYMISDLLLGGDLSYHLKNQGRFSESRAKLSVHCIPLMSPNNASLLNKLKATFGEDLVVCYPHISKSRIAHFDVKPANILLDEQGHAHLSDFGLAKRLAEGQLAQEFSGTRLYMAPEILLTALGDLRGYDWRVDWWALGVCFYEMLRGRAPHEYPSSFSSLQVLSIIYTRCVTMPSRWPSDLISFLRSIINPEPQFRLDSFEKFRQHSYMERIKWRDVFDRRMVPIFVPPKEHRDALARRNYRATISVPFSSHRAARHHRHFLKQLHPKDEPTSANASERGDSSHKELENEVANLSARFKNFNRFKCETQVAEPRHSLNYIVVQPKRVASKTKSPKLSSARGVPSRPFMQADRMRQFHANNRDVNYSM